MARGSCLSQKLSSSREIFLEKAFTGRKVSPSNLAGLNGAKLYLRVFWNAIFMQTDVLYEKIFDYFSVHAIGEFKVKVVDAV